MYLNRINIVLIFIFSAFASFGQSDLEQIQTDFQKIIAKIDSADAVKIDVEAKSYSRIGGSLLSTTKASRSQDKNHSKVVLGELEIIETSDYSLRIDHDEHAILVVAKKRAKPSKSNESSQLDLRELLKLIKSKEQGSNAIVKLVSNTNGIRKYKITGLTGLRSTEMQLNMNNLTIDRISFEYGTASAPGQYILLEYNIQYDEELSFSLSNYFTEINKELQPSSQLEGYKLYTEE